MPLECKSKNHSYVSYCSTYNFATSMRNDGRGPEQEMASQMHAFLITVEMFQQDKKDRTAILV